VRKAQILESGCTLLAWERCSARARSRRIVTVNSSGSLETVIGPRPVLSLGLRELWQYRELFYFFAWRDIKVKYKHTSLGVAWAVLQPVLLTVVFTLLFGRRIQEAVNFPYPVFAFSGLLLWNVFASGLMSAGTSMVASAHIIQKVYFPRLIVPISSLMVALFDFLMGLPVLLVLSVWFECPPRASAPLFFLAGLGLAVAGALGAGCWLAAVCVKYRDFRYVLPFLVQLLLFLTPVIYPVAYAREAWVRFLLAVNPMSGAVGLFRGMFSDQPLERSLMAISVVSAIVLVAEGLLYFRRTEAYFADLA
jgi:lipopolysaccharide transport system permease protein